MENGSHCQCTILDRDLCLIPLSGMCVHNSGSWMPTGSGDITAMHAML